MANYLVGDVQGCATALERLLQKIGFSPSRDKLYFLGDLVNRGPNSLQVIRRLMAYGGSIRCVLGNHDIYLLTVGSGQYSPKPGDTLLPFLQAKDASILLGWLRERPLALYEHGCLMVHAGVLPQWGLAQTIYWARTLEKYLLQNHLKAGLRSLWGDSQENWHEDLTIKQKLRLAINALTRIRFCYHDGRLDFTNKGKLTTPGTQAWFDLPTRKTRDTLIAFGHWSQLGYINQPKLIALDTGCVWGGHLSALRFGQDFQERELIQVQCDNTVI